MPTITFRCDPELESELERLSKSEKRSKTDVIREALRDYAARRPRRAAKPKNAYEALKEYIGIWDGPGNLSENTGKTFKKIMGEIDEKKRAGRL
jgi:predicted DNA-binding protein